MGRRTVLFKLFFELFELLLKRGDLFLQVINCAFELSDPILWGLYLRQRNFPGEQMRVTERITRVDEDTLDYEFTVTDPNTWAEPWGGVYPLTQLDGVLFEYACTEGNYGMGNILSGARVGEEKEAAQ